ncbi:MAG: hypothetical protein OEM15_11270 [Myxococcales bacterium]|nr:hypothetical protein [Myxococcales bacterium]MDH3483188.1 hypothetical protein [Myxococcales bacterium]
MGDKHRATCAPLTLMTTLALVLGVAACKKGKDVETAADAKPTRPLSPSGTMSLTGNYSHAGAIGTFQDCTTGERWLVAHEGENGALEEAYLDSKVSLGSPLLVIVEGGIDLRPSLDGPGDETMLIVARFVETRPTEVCPSVDDASVDD